jgi:hypothetical protein
MTLEGRGIGQFRLGKKIGAGSFGEIYIGKYHNTFTPFSSFCLLHSLVALLINRLIFLFLLVNVLPSSSLFESCL